MSPISNNILEHIEEIKEELIEQGIFYLVDSLNPIVNYVQSQENYIEELLQSLADYEKRR